MGSRLRPVRPNSPPNPTTPPNLPVLENQLCLGASLLVDLRQPGSQNPFAIGAVVTLQTSIGDLTRDVRVNSGYLSGDAAQLHFGFLEDSNLEKLIINWPDGQITTISNLETNQTLTVERQ
ncbi:MAG: ASPIC/UnbV domain-containing protein [Candidatus Promineifilaceae bacterium]